MKRLLYLVIFLIAVFPLCAIPVYGDVKPGTDVKSMKELVNLAKDLSCEQVLISGDNNVAALVDVNSLAHLSWKKNKGKVDFTSKVLPAVCSIKSIAFFAFNCQTSDYALSVMNGVYQEDYIKPFDFIIAQSELLGVQEKNGFYADKYQIAASWNMEQIQDSGKEQLYISKTGAERILDKALEFKMTHFQSGEDVVLAVWSDYPEIGLKDIYHKTLDSLKNDRTMAIFIDGLGWHLLENYCAVNNLDLAEMKYLPTRSVYPSKTKYAYYTLGTGEYLPEDSPGQIYPDKAFLNGVIIEEEKCYYTSPTAVLLNVDENDNGTIDDEIFDSAMKYIQDEKKLFILVHFHSVDDMNHEYGPYSQESMNQLKVIFDYTQKLIDTFVGRVIIFSDHGAHSYLNQGGTHGSVKAEDIVGVVKYVEKD